MNFNVLRLFFKTGKCLIIPTSLPFFHQIGCSPYFNEFHRCFLNQVGFQKLQFLLYQIPFLSSGTKINKINKINIPFSPKPPAVWSTTAARRPWRPPWSPLLRRKRRRRKRRKRRGGRWRSGCRRWRCRATCCCWTKCRDFQVDFYGMNQPKVKHMGCLWDFDGIFNRISIWNFDWILLDFTGIFMRSFNFFFFL